MCSYLDIVCFVSVEVFRGSIPVLYQCSLVFIVTSEDYHRRMVLQTTYLHEKRDLFKIFAIAHYHGSKIIKLPKFRKGKPYLVSIDISIITFTSIGKGYFFIAVYLICRFLCNGRQKVVCSRIHRASKHKVLPYHNAKFVCELVELVKLVDLKSEDSIGYVFSKLKT